MMTDSPGNCPHCEADATAPFYTSRSVPAFCNVLWDTRQAARTAATGDIELCHCDACGVVFNRAFDPRLVEYAPGYENPLHFSPRFRDFADSLSSRLVDDHGLRGRVAVEIGCGDADFLRCLTAHGLGRGIGFDPSLPGDARMDDARVKVFAAPFDADRLPAEADLLVCRHVLEHIPMPGDWLRSIKRALHQREIVFYCEVPNAQWLLESRSLWDVIYEHVTYWTPSSIERLFRGAGFHVRSVGTGFDDQFLMIEALNDPSKTNCEEPGNPPPRENHELCESFAREADGLIAGWRQALREASSSRRVAVAWGGGSKGVTFANQVSTGSDLAGVVDINPGKQGKFIPGAGTPVIAPDQLVSINPELVFVMNANYLDEIRDQLANLGLAPHLFPVTAEIP